MPPFAALERRVNAAVMASLTNALARFNGAPGPVRVIFDADYALAAVGDAGLAATAPAITVSTAQLPAPVVGARVDVTTATGLGHWRVAEHHPDGAGLSVLLLERLA